MTRERHIDEIIKRSGIREQLVAEAEQERATAYEAARSRKEARVARFLVDRPRAEERHGNAKAAADMARRKFEAAVADLAKATQALDQVVGDFALDRDALDAELGEHADPRADALIAELQQIRRSPTFRRETHEELSRAVIQVGDLIDEAKRIRVAGERGDIVYLSAAIEALRARIPR